MTIICNIVFSACKVITKEQRTVEFLQETVSAIVKALAETNAVLQEKYPVLSTNINENVFFITAQELEDMYPDKSGKERENLITKEHGTVFIMGIGARLKSGHRHDGRAPDYDDWSLNGDILVWDKELDAALEISSMGIRVDAEALKKQLEIANATERMSFPYHQGVLSGEYPLTIGGGLGRSRICMLLLGKAHVGEVQVSIWPDDMREKCAENGIILL